MTRRVFLHIGAPKTGTTYLQDRLTINAKTLAQHDVHFPARNPLISPGLSQFRAALDLLDQDWGGQPGHAKGSWDALVKRVKRLSCTVIISHEILAPAHPVHVERVQREIGDLPNTELHIVYSARDQGRQVPAAWQESIKQGRTWTYRTYLKRVSNQRPWFARAFDLPEVLSTWSAGMPPERVHVVTVPHGRGDTLWLRFCEVFGIDPAWAPLESERDNSSLGIAETQLLRKLNKRTERVARQETSSDELIRNLLADNALFARNRKPLAMPPRMHPWAVEQGERWIEWIEGSGVDVVGDLAELLPGPAVTRAAYVDPDKVGAKRQLAAALDALTAMTHEASRRTDPADRFAAKVRTRVRGRSADAHD